MSKGFFLRYIEVITSSFEKWYNIILELLFTDSDYWRIVYWVCITLILVVYLLFKKSHFSKFISRKLLLSSVIIWFVGFVLYIIGYYKKSLLGLAVVPRAFFASLKMFAMSCDISNVAENLREDAIYTMLFMLTHLAAVYLTFVFIFKMVGYKAKSAWRIIRYGSSFNPFCSYSHGVSSCGRYYRRSVYDQEVGGKTGGILRTVRLCAGKLLGYCCYKGIR